MKKKLLSVLIVGVLSLSVGCAKNSNTAKLDKPVVEKTTEEAPSVGGETNEEDKENATAVVAEGGPTNVTEDGQPILDKDGIPIDNYLHMADEMYTDIQPILSDAIQYSNTKIVYYKEGVLHLEVYVAYDPAVDDALNFALQFPLAFADITEVVDYHVEADFHIVDSAVYNENFGTEELGYTVYAEKPAVLDTIEINSTHAFSTEE